MGLHAALEAQALALSFVYDFEILEYRCTTDIAVDTYNKCRCSQKRCWFALIHLI